MIFLCFYLEVSELSCPSVSTIRYTKEGGWNWREWFLRLMRQVYVPLLSRTKVYPIQHGDLERDRDRDLDGGPPGPTLNMSMREKGERISEKNVSAHPPP